MPALVQGGFGGWQAAGLPTTEPGAAEEYNASAADFVADNVELLVQKVGPGRGRGEEPANNCWDRPGQGRGGAWSHKHVSRARLRKGN